MLKDGSKTIELRLFDDKRKQIKTNDIIEFCNSSDKNDHFQAKVINQHIANNFEELCKKINPNAAGFKSNDSLLAVLETFYPADKQSNTGVICIEIQKII